MYVYYDRLGLHGRLGNALYELASTAGIAHAMGVEPRYNATWIHRPYFSVPDQFFTDDFRDSVRADETPAVDHIDPRHRSYLQDWNLFTEILPTIREWLKPSDLARDRLVEHTADFDMLPRPVLSVHVRRGDNAPGGDPGTPNKHLWHPMPTLRYYQWAWEQLAPKAASIAVFSDDPDWCERYLPGASLYYRGVTRPKEHEADYLTAPVLDWIDWQMQVACTYHVLSNSTFGMMAAIVAGDSEAIIPWPIFGPNLDYVRSDLLIPEAWTRMVYGAPDAS